MCETADLFALAIAQSFDRHVLKPWRNHFNNQKPYYQDSIASSVDERRF